MEVGYLTPHPFSSCFVEHFLLILVKTWNIQGITQERSLFGIYVSGISVNFVEESTATHLSIRKPDCLIKAMSTKV